MHDESAETSVDVRLIGDARSVQNVLLVLQFLYGCSELGTTQWVKLMVDGDGGFRFALERDGRPARLSDEERAYLFAESEEAPPVPQHLAHLYFSRIQEGDEAVLSVELV